MKEIDSVRAWLEMQPNENDTSHNRDYKSNSHPQNSNYQDHRTQSSVMDSQRQIDYMPDDSIRTGTDKRFDYQTSHRNPDEVRDMRQMFINTLHYR